MNTTVIRSSQKTSRFHIRGRWLVLSLIIIGILGSAAHMPEPPIRKFTLVLDAGHGGSDPGNLGTGRKKRTEKDISLDVTLMVGKYIQEKYPEVEQVINFLIYISLSHSFFWNLFFVSSVSL